MVRCHLVLDLSSSPVRSADWMVCLGQGRCIFALVKIKQEAFSTDLRVSVGLTVHVHICLMAQAVQSDMLCGHTSQHLSNTIALRSARSEAERGGRAEKWHEIRMKE